MAFFPWRALDPPRDHENAVLGFRWTITLFLKQLRRCLVCAGLRRKTPTVPRSLLSQRPIHKSIPLVNASVRQYRPTWWS